MKNISYLYQYATELTNEELLEELCKYAVAGDTELVRIIKKVILERM